VKLEAYLIIK